MPAYLMEYSYPFSLPAKIDISFINYEEDISILTLVKKIEAGGGKILRSQK
jgi:hypothetical protein